MLVEGRNKKDLREFLLKDPVRTYFILLGLYREKSPYKKIYLNYRKGELLGLVGLRHTGLAQVYSIDGDMDPYYDLLKTLDYRFLNIARSQDLGLGQKLGLSLRSKTYLSLYKQGKLEAGPDLTIRPMNLDDLDRVVEIYEENFQSFGGRSTLEARLRGRGRGRVLVEGSRIIASVQSDFESEDKALIVALATDSQYKNKGYGTRLMKSISQELYLEGKLPYIQYDNLDAGRIYKAIGYENIDEILRYERNE